MLRNNMIQVPCIPEEYQITLTEVNEMPTIIAGEKLTEAVISQTFIKGGDVNCAEGVKYDFRVSSKILKASYGTVKFFV